MKRLFLLFVILVAHSFVFAQESDEPTDELPVVEGFIFKWENEILFPEGVRFRLTVSRIVDDLTSSSLTIEPAGLNAIQVEMDLEEPVVTGPNFTEFAFVWPFPDGFAPQMFQDDEIFFEWRAEDLQGETAFVRDALLFTDPRVEWVTGEDAQGVLNVTVPAGEITPSRIQQSIRQPYNLMAANTGQSPAFDLILYWSDLDPTGCELVEDEDTGEGALMVRGPRDDSRLPCDPAQSAAVFATSDLSMVQSRGTSLNSAQAALVEFLVPQFYLPIWEEADVPDWFLSGLTQFYLPTNKASLLTPVRNAGRNNRLYTLDDLNTEEDRGDEWQAQSFAMVLYMADQIGVEAFFELANDVGSASSFAAAYEQASGQDIQTLLPNLQRWIFTDAAASAFNYTPYMAETPVPTETRTPSPFPPTATNTATVTSPPTLTPSVTGVLSPTPTLTRTATRTPTPPPATVTPRPASSLFTPTVTPVPGVLENPVNRLGAIAVLLILAAIVGLVYVILGRRNA